MPYNFRGMKLEKITAPAAVGIITFSLTGCGKKTENEPTTTYVDLPSNVCQPLGELASFMDSPTADDIEPIRDQVDLVHDNTALELDGTTWDLGKQFDEARDAANKAAVVAHILDDENSSSEGYGFELDVAIDDAKFVLENTIGYYCENPTTD